MLTEAHRGSLICPCLHGRATGEIAEDDPDQLVDAIMACLDGISRRMVSLDPDEVRLQLPEARIILRMLDSVPARARPN
jgi:hypothetical protein